MFPHCVETAFLLFVWYTSSVIVVVNIKTATADDDGKGNGLGFPYALGATFFVNGLMAALAQAILLVWDACDRAREDGGDIARSERKRVPMKDIAIIGLLQGVEICCTNLALHLLSLSFRTMLHAAYPAFILLAGLAAGVEDWSPMCAAAIALMVTGGVVSTEAESALGKLNWGGLVLSVIAGSVSTVRWVFTQVVLQRRSKDGAHPRDLLEMQRTTSTIISAVAAVASLIFEHGAPAALAGMPGAKRSHFFMLIAFSSVGVLALAFAELRLVSLTSALTVSVFAVLHNVLFIIAGIVEFNDDFNWRHALGTAFTLVGMGLYTELRRLQSEKTQVPDEEIELTARD
jgi:drug/metabolite transporter (DMT)-like permease